MASLLWLQGGACSGNTMSFLNAEEPSACDLVTDFGIDVLWHPSLGMDMGAPVQQMLRELASGERELVDSMMKALEKKNYGVRSMIHEVIQSDLFRKK